MIASIVAHEFGGDRVMRRPTAGKPVGKLTVFRVVWQLERVFRGRIVVCYPSIVK